MRMFVLLISAALTVASCSPKGEVGAPCKQVEDCVEGLRCHEGACRKPLGRAASPRDLGRVRVADKSYPVRHIVSHEPKMDLFVQCRARKDATKKAGAELPLCYENTKRTPTHLRVERSTRRTLKLARRNVSEKNEAMHFVIEPSGSIYQVLDLAYGPRRAGQVRKGEIRVLSGHEDRHKTLYENLKRHFPELTIEVVDVKAPAAAPIEKKPASP